MKQRLKRLFFPDFCFDKPAKYNRTTLHRKIFCLLLYLGFFDAPFKHYVVFTR